MKQYYLLAQLPAFSVSDDHASLPFSEEYFNELCSRFLDKPSMQILAQLSLEPPRAEKTTGSVFVDTWYDKERSLRLALEQIRALRMKKKIDGASETLPQEIVQTARTAIGMDSPLAAEQYLNTYRVRMIDDIYISDPFSTDAVFAYGLKLKLAVRIRKFNAEKGMVAYHTIYDRILGETK